MEEEMCGEQDQKKQANVADGDVKQTTGGGHLKKNHRWTWSRASFDLGVDDFVKDEDLVANKRSQRNHKTLNSVYLNVMVEELCSRIHEDDVNCLGHGQDGEIAIQSIEDQRMEKFNIQKNSWMHFKAGSNSHLVKHVQKLQDIHVEGDRFKVLGGSDFFEQDLSNRKRHSFF